VKREEREAEGKKSDETLHGLKMTNRMGAASVESRFSVAMVKTSGVLAA